MLPATIQNPVFQTFQLVLVGQKYSNLTSKVCSITESAPKLAVIYWNLIDISLNF